MMAAPQKLDSKPVWVNRWEVESESSNRTYVVGQKADGSYGCDCPAWKFQKAPRHDCKHILFLKATEPVDRLGVIANRPEVKAARAARTNLKPAGFTEQERARAEAREPEPVFLLQTRRKIRMTD